MYFSLKSEIEFICAQHSPKTELPTTTSTQCPTTFWTTQPTGTLQETKERKSMASQSSTLMPTTEATGSPTTMT